MKMAILDLKKLLIVLVLFEGLLGDKTCTDESGRRKSCYKIFRKAGIIPKYAKRLKSTDMEVRYNNEKIHCGDTVNLVEEVHAPTVKFDLTGKCVNVTLLSFSPDSPAFSPYLLWLVHNIPAKAMKEGYTNDLIDIGIADSNPGDIKANYQPATNPVAGVLKNTIVYFIYCQCRYIEVQTKYILTDRYQFDIKRYIKDNGMGYPAAGFIHMFSPTGVSLPSVVTLPDTVKSSVVPETPALPVNLPIV